MRALVTGATGLRRPPPRRPPREPAATTSLGVDRHSDPIARHHERPADRSRHRRASGPTPSTTWPAGPTWAARGTTRSRPSGPTPRARSTSSRPCRAAGVHRVLAVASADVYGVVTRPSCPSPRTSPAPPGQPLRASEGGRRLTSPCRPGSATGSGVMRVRAFNHLGPGQTEQFVAPALAARIARSRARRRRRHPRRQPRRPPGLHRRPRRRAGLPPARRARRAGRGLQRLLRPRRRRAGAGRPAGRPRPTARSARGRPRRCCARSTCPCCAATTTKLSKATGWEPEIPIEQTLADLLDDWRSRVELAPSDLCLSSARSAAATRSTRRRDRPDPAARARRAS